MLTTVANIRVISLNEYAPVWAGPMVGPAFRFRFIGSMFILPISNMQFYGLNYKQSGPNCLVYSKIMVEFL